MKEKWIAQVDELIEGARHELAADTIKLVNIKSVQGEPLPGAPFGEGPRKVLDTVLEMGEKDGFFTTDYNVGVVSVAMKEGQPDLGIWAHGDVVPEGDGWSFAPYDAVEYQGCIIGRGATDNKGQLAAIFHLMKIFKKLEIPLKYNVGLYVGSNEESGMKDMTGIPGNPDAKGFVNVCTPPRMSLVPDSGFPVGYGGKGSLKMTLKSKMPLHGFTFIAGQDDSPGKAVASFFIKGKNAEFEVVTQSAPRHGSNPDPDGNMITKLAGVLLDHDMVAEEDRYILDFLKRVSLASDGAMFHIDVDTKIMKPLTLTTKKVSMAEGYPELLIDIRYPIEITADEVIKRVSEVGEENGFLVSHAAPGVDPYLMNAETEMLKRLTEIANEVTQTDGAPYILGGATYAHRLPNALVYGMNGCLPPKDFPKGRGGAHGIDEAVSLDRLQRAMKIYARALLELNEMEW